MAPDAGAIAEERGRGVGYDDDYTDDGTVNLKGKPVLRSKTGGWKACSFIVVYEVFERLAYYGIGFNLILYMTRELHEGTVESANNVTNWAGTVWFLPVLGAYIADAHLGRFWTFIISSVIYLLGMSLLTLVVSLPALRPPSCGPNIGMEACNMRATPFQRGIFFAALYIIAIGTGGTKANISTMGADQFNHYDPKERKQKLSFFNWWTFSIFIGTLLSNTLLVYIQDNVGWSLGYGLPTVGLLISIIVFMIGIPFYRHKLPDGSPLTRITHVIVAAARKRKVPIPMDPKDFYQPSIEQTRSKYTIEHTSSLRFLDRAAVRTESSSPWMLCPVTHVEETKQIIKMVPILVFSFIPSTIITQVGTLFVKQGASMDRHIGPNFQIPPASLIAFVTVTFLGCLVIYDLVFVPAVRRYTKNPRGITMLQRMGIGMAMHVLIMCVAGYTESKRLRVAREHNKIGMLDVVPMSIFMLLPQFILMGIADTFVDVAKMEFFYDQAPEGMKSLGASYFTTSMGVGNYLSTFLLTVVAEITKKNGKGWILNNLNVSHLDYFYYFLALLSLVNFLLFLVAAKFYVYNVDVSTPKAKPPQ